MTCHITFNHIISWKSLLSAFPCGAQKQCQSFSAFPSDLLGNFPPLMELSVCHRERQQSNVKMVIGKAGLRLAFLWRFQYILLPDLKGWEYYLRFWIFFQFSSVTQTYPILWPPWTAAHQASLSITNSWSVSKLMSIKSVMPSKHLILSCPLLLLPSIFPSIRIFSNEPVLHIRWPKYWSFSFSISLSNEYSGLISFRMDWLDLLAVQGILKSLSNTTVSLAHFKTVWLDIQNNWIQ